MRLPGIYKGLSTISRLALILSLLLLLIPFYFLFIYKTFDERMSSAELQFEDWEMIGCTELCESLLKEKPGNLGLQKLYGKVLLATGDLYKARHVFLNLLTKDSVNVTSHKFDLAFTYFYLGNLDSSSLLVNEILSALKPGVNPLLSAKCLNLLGLIAFNNAQYKLALYYQEESLMLAREARSLNAEADALRQIGVLNWYEGKIDSVIIKYYEPALYLYRVAGDKKGEATTISNIGHIYGMQENWFEKTRCQFESISIRKKINDRIGIADSYYFLTHSIPFSDKGRSFAYSYYKKSFELSSKIGYAWGKEIALRGLIDIQTKAVDFELPELQLDTNLISFAEGKIYIIWAKALKNKEEGDFLSAAAEYKKVIELCDSLQIMAGIETPLLNYADVLITLGEYDEAQKMVERALQITTFISRPHGYSESKFRLANLFFYKGMKRESAALFKELIQFYDSTYIGYLNTINPSLAFETAAGNVHFMRSKVYRDYVRNLISINRYDEAFEAVEKERLLPFWGEREYESSPGNSEENNLISELINLIEEYDKNDFASISDANTKIGEIYQAMLTRKDAYSVSLQGQDTTINIPGNDFYNLGDILNILNPGEVILEYFVDEEQIYVFILKSSGMQAINLKIKTNNLMPVVDIFNETILKGKESPENNLWKAPSEYLYSILIKPLESENLIKPNDHLFISPHQFIHSIPFQALLNESGKFLIEDYSLTYLPSANYLVKRRNELNINLKNAAAIAPDYTSLPFTKNEIGDVTNVNFLSLKKFINEDAGVIRFLKEACNFDLIHIAAHGKINRKYPLYSYMEFADRRIELHEIIKLKLKSALVFLSSCEAGMSVGESGIYPSGHDMVSFPRAFITAGASSVISPMWLVEDESTAELVKNFYKQLSIKSDSNIPAYLSKTLTTAQRKLIAKYRKSEKKNHPFYWAGFFISGGG